MSEVRLIDANALIKDIAESIRLADEWEKEAREKEDQHGIKCAIDTRRSLLAMISRVKEAPTVEAEPVRRGRWVQSDALDYVDPNGIIHIHGMCSCCRLIYDFRDMTSRFKFCPKCGARMDLRTPTEVQLDEADSVMMGGDGNDSE